MTPGGSGFGGGSPGGGGLGGTGSGSGSPSGGGSDSGGGLGGTGSGSGAVTNPEYLQRLDESRGGMSLGAALLNLDTQESAPFGGSDSGIGLLAKQQREINRLKWRVSGIEQILVV
jgi:hypothetical protein